MAEWGERVGLKETVFATFACADYRSKNKNQHEAKLKKRKAKKTHTFRGDLSGYGVALLLPDCC